jgi:hypothetical protein
MLIYMEGDTGRQQHPSPTLIWRVNVVEMARIPLHQSDRFAHHDCGHSTVSTCRFAVLIQQLDEQEFVQDVKQIVNDTGVVMTSAIARISLTRHNG